jgi:hypothetical protein
MYDKRISGLTKRTILAVAASAGAILIIAAIWPLIFNHAPMGTFHDSFSHGDVKEWKTYGGVWELRDGTFRNLTAARGDKAVTGSERWTDYTVTSDLRFDSDPQGMHWGDAGVILRVTQPSVGVDSYDGYYVGIGIEDRVLFIGRANYAWNRLATSSFHDAVKLGKWYRLSVKAKGCYLEASATDHDTNTVTSVSYYDEGCRQRAGAVGLRTFSVQASWRDFQVGPHG